MQEMIGEVDMSKLYTEVEQPDENEIIYRGRGRTIWHKRSKMIEAEYTLIATADGIRLVVYSTGFAKEVIYETKKSWELFSSKSNW